ncbi:iron complex transport system substrate-binding protein [Microbacterium resistens]|uniref:Iron complex transport system substrate-binding protein n=1 Tax=Microbacterium resistens TaxID=156977 RepID=A0ABU1SEJ1_9MICO|nr:iron-siderophore ABC transporter substrate-binding protein [Microbacterium resistens]MDR6868030.1 iron complex transport system substrate-binding protein [Microbacterium resistens]
MPSATPSTTPPSARQASTPQHDAPQHDAPERSATQRSATRRSATERSTTRRRVARGATLVAALTASALVLSACAGGSPAASTTEGSASASTSGAAFPATVKHVYGETTIAAQPERVATVGWGSFDAAIALGTIPVTIPTSAFGDTDGDGYLAWTHDAITAAKADLPPLHDETDGIPYEKIADTSPDLVLGTNSGLSQQEYDTLTKIAPTVAYPGTPWGTAWRDSTRMVGEALGVSDKAETLIADTEKSIAEEMAKYPAAKGKTGMVMWVDAKDLGKVQFYTPQDTRVKYLNDLGFATPASITELAKGEKSFVSTIAAEQADKLDADVAVIYVQGGDLTTLQNDPLLSRIPAVKSGAAVLMNDQERLMAISAPTVLSIPWALASYAKDLGEAAAKAG